MPASRVLGKSEAVALAARATKVIVAKGRSVREFKQTGKVTKELAGAMLGPTGNLRAPTIRKGSTVVVGFNEDVFEAVFG